MSKKFGAESTTDDVLEGVDLAGKRILVTGVSAGLGTETARALVAHGAEVVGTVRSLEKAHSATAKAGIGTAGNGSLKLVEMDLASLASVRACADALLAKAEKFDVIIANAGVMACPKGLTVDGFETQFGTNHLGHFVFINRIASLLKPGGRLVNLSSSGHQISDVDLEDPNFEHTPYSEFGAYGRSKTANVLFAVEFDRRHRQAGIRAAAVHPGVIQTELSRHMTAEALENLNQRMKAAQASGASTTSRKSVPQGAATSIWAGIVASPEEVGGRFCEDCHVAETIQAPNSRQGVCAYAVDPEHAKALWAKSEEMVGERF